MKYGNTGVQERKPQSVRGFLRQIDLAKLSLTVTLK
jgi:hypothetical protein